MPAVIFSTEKNSIAADLGLLKGDVLISICGKCPSDYIDYSFLCASENIQLEILHPDGQTETFEIQKDFDEDLGIIFESAVFDKIKPCLNHCIFCFVDGQPPGLRKTLYIKDDDYRLSYLQGSYVTLTNLTDIDKKRIASMHLGPFYVSVHSMNPDIRVKLLGNPRAGRIKDDLDFLLQNDIPFHAQIVLCPGINDDSHLIFTLQQLALYKSILLSVAIVPVGITKYRSDNIMTVDKNISLRTIQIVNEFNKRKLPFKVCLSDEFFILAGIQIPEKKYYGKFSQLDDGVGSLRLLIDDFEKRKKTLPRSVRKPLHITLAVSKAAFRVFETVRFELNKINNLTVDLLRVDSAFWGDNITVAGLITSDDLIDSLHNLSPEHLFIPSVMLSPYTDEFLDGRHLFDVQKILNCNIYPVKDIYSVKQIIDFIKKSA